MSSSPLTFSRNERRIFILLIILGLSLTLFFGFRTVRSYIRLERMGLKPGTTDVAAIRGWMTIPYVTTAYGVPEEYIFKIIDIPAQANRKKSLSQINFRYAFGKKGAIVEKVKAAVSTYQTEHLTPPESNHE